MERLTLSRTSGDGEISLVSTRRNARRPESGSDLNIDTTRLGDGYDEAGNLSNRVQNAQTNVFRVNNLNQLTSTVRTNPSATVAGFTTLDATSVTVAANGGAATPAIRYADRTYARTNVTLLNGNNTFTAVATSGTRGDTNTTTVNLPVAVTFLHDLNGNLRTNGTRLLEYDDENQLTRVTEPGAWKAEFVYDGKLRMRVSRDYEWRNGAWTLTNEVRRVYDGMLVLQERDQFNVPRITYTRGGVNHSVRHSSWRRTIRLPHPQWNAVRRKPRGAECKNRPPVITAQSLAPSWQRQTRPQRLPT